ncbi:unnamed protein product [Lupinus luteus]|uniref:Uncharacterized protein n=1 Tax=Lupinus luteus TaxID=3873 RepID=A0AAV1W2U3_LUPLU
MMKGKLNDEDEIGDLCGYGSNSAASRKIGIGYALAREFLKAGDNVLICSRSSEEQLLMFQLLALLIS